MGGAFSLYLGISIAMIFEFIELIFDVLVKVLIGPTLKTVSPGYPVTKSAGIYPVYPGDGKF